MSHNKDNKDRPQVVTRDTEENKKEERPNNTNLGLQMTGLQTEEGKTVQNLTEYSEDLTKAEQRKTLEEAERIKKERGIDTSADKDRFAQLDKDKENKNK